MDKSEKFEKNVEKNFRKNFENEFEKNVRDQKGTDERGTRTDSGFFSEPSPKFPIGSSSVSSEVNAEGVMKIRIEDIPVFEESDAEEETSEEKV